MALRADDLLGMARRRQPARGRSKVLCPRSKNRALTRPTSGVQVSYALANRLKRAFRHSMRVMSQRQTKLNVIRSVLQATLATRARVGNICRNRKLHSSSMQRGAARSSLATLSKHSGRKSKHILYGHCLQNLSRIWSMAHVKVARVTKASPAVQKFYQLAAMHPNVEIPSVRQMPPPPLDHTRARAQLSPYGWGSRRFPMYTAPTIESPTCAHRPPPHCGET